MKKKIFKVILFSSIVASSMVGLNAKGFEINAAATTQEVYILGASYVFNDNIKVGAGGVAINSLENALTPTKDDFLGAYATVELKYPIRDKFEFFIDGTYINGEFDKSNKNDDGSIGVGGFKYNLNNKYTFFTGYSTEQSAFGGVDYSFDPKWKLTLAGSYNFDFDEGQAIFSLSYNFGSGMNSALTTSAKYLFEDRYRAPVNNNNGGGNDQPTLD